MAIEIGIYGGAVPVGVAIALVFLARKFSPPPVSERFALAAALAAAFFVGWMLLPDDWTPLSPQRSWHWLPYLGLWAAALGGIAERRASSARPTWFAAQRLGANLLIAAVAAWLLAPNWPEMEPPRYVYVSLLTAYLFALATLVGTLPDRLLGRLFPWLLFAAASATAIVIGQPLSMMFAQVAGLAAASLFGCALAVWHGVSASALRGLIPVYVVHVGGMAFSASIEPEPPIYSILLAPLAPLMLWIGASGPLARLTGLKAAAVQIAVVLVPLAILVGWTVLSGEPEYSEWDY